MKTQVLAVRLQEDQLAILQKMADSRGIKASDLVKQMITAALAGAQSGSGSSIDVIARIEQLEANILGANSWLADSLITNLKATAGARFMAQVAAENSDEVISYLANKEPLDPKTKAEWQKSRAKEEARQGELLVNSILNEGQKE